MKIIDQKGRFFGVINVIDLSVILILLSFIPLLFIGYKVAMGKKTKDVQWVSVQIKFAGIEPEFSNIISIGDTEKDGSGKKIGKLTGIASIKPSKALVVVDNNTLSAVDDPVKRDILVNADILCTKKDSILYYKSAPVKIGNTIIFATDLYNFSGLVVALKVDNKR